MDDVAIFWKKIGKIATFVAFITIPSVAYWFHSYYHWSWLWSIIGSIIFVVTFRGFLEIFFSRVLVRPKLTLDAEREDMDEDALNRRRLYFWKKKLKQLTFFFSMITVFWLFRGGTWASNLTWFFDSLRILTDPAILMQFIILPIFFVANFVLFFGPMMMMGISQMKSLEPGDADFGVKLDDVRGQSEGKEEIRKIVTLWQAGEEFVKHGGKRERGVLFLGPPGTGKTMLAKAISTGFNAPIILMPGSGFAQTFIGMDVIIVRWMARKARKLASKWGGQAIIFIDEIDAVGMRRVNLGGGGFGGFQAPQIPGGMFGGMGSLGLQSLLVVMDGIDNPPFFRKFLTNRVNLWLDASYFVPPKYRLRRAKPTTNQIFFIGATNVPLEALDPALVRPGRMGRHIYFRMPTKGDRLDIFDLYLGKVSHDPDLDTEEAREELARVTNGYSPAQIEQVCSIALTYAHHSKREAFSRSDLLEAMVTVEAGTALGWGYESPEEERSTAIHEAGHAVCSHLYMKGSESTRLSIRKRGASGGHHQSIETIERTFHTRDELFSHLVWGLGAYAAEHVFYGHNTQGVGGDLQQSSWLAGLMVGRWGMAPLIFGSSDKKKLSEIGDTLLAIALPGDIKVGRGKEHNEALLLGQAFVVAWNTIKYNKAAIEKIAETLLREKEIYGNDLLELLESCGLEEPKINWANSNSYPVL